MQFVLIDTKSVIIKNTIVSISNTLNERIRCNILVFRQLQKRHSIHYFIIK
jgi:hypothetical protein